MQVLSKPTKPQQIPPDLSHNVYSTLRKRPRDAWPIKQTLLWAGDLLNSSSAHYSFLQRSARLGKAKPVDVFVHHSLRTLWNVLVTDANGDNTVATTTTRHETFYIKKRQKHAT
jgi:hypothetical protein